MLFAAMLGGGAATFAGFERRPSGLLTPKTATGGKTIDAYKILQNAIQTRTKLVWGGTPAYADVPTDLCVITIKVMNQICPPLAFRLGEIQGTSNATTGPQAFDSTITGSQGSGARRLSDGLTLLTARGIAELAPAAMGGGRYRALRFNRWFANILDTGMVEGTGTTDVVATPLEAADIGPFPADVAIQAVLGVNQSVSASNHDFNNCAITGSNDSSKGGDLGYHVSELASNLVPSPLGVVCFNMGKVTETDGNNSPNRVLKPDTATAAVDARSVTNYVSTIQQAVALGLTSYIDDDLVQQFDKIANPPLNFAGELKARKAQIQTIFSRIQAAGALESTVTTITGVTNAERGALQDFNATANTDARMEFLAQCKFVQAALDIDGKPFRNFTLYCHLSDIDGASFDKTVADTQTTEGLSYIEGMRQLAVGLNMLAKSISKYRNVYVAVVSEGGRDFTGSDNDVGFALILGPGGAGGLADKLYSPGSYNQANNAFVSDPGNNTTDFRLAGGNGRLSGAGLLDQMGGVVVNEDGLASANKIVTNNEVLIGLIRHIEERKNITNTSTKGLGRFLKLTTG
jgi:hypothetical protein